MHSSPVTTMWSAPMARATRRFTRPIGPAPQMSTRDPSVTPARRHACTATESGSSSAPSSKVTWSGSLWTQKIGHKALVLKRCLSSQSFVNFQINYARISNRAAEAIHFHPFPLLFPLPTLGDPAILFTTVFIIDTSYSF